MGRWFLVGGCVVVDWWLVFGGGGDVACGVMGCGRHKHDNKNKGWSNPHVGNSSLLKTTEAKLHVRNADRALR